MYFHGGDKASEIEVMVLKLQVNNCIWIFILPTIRSPLLSDNYLPTLFLAIVENKVVDWRLFGAEVDKLEGQNYKFIFRG